MIAEQSCGTCKTTHLLPGNCLAWELIARTSPVLFDGMGGVNTSAIETAMRVYDIPASRQHEIWQKFLVYVAVVREKKS